MSSATAIEVAVVGAGAAGVGVALALQRAGVDSVVVLERRRIGESFRHWPREMQFITPSFPGNAFGQIDLNAIHPQSSPALFLGREHPRGKEYARYLERVVEQFRLPVREGEEVLRVQVSPGAFDLTTSGGSRRARFLVWAAGEFQYPRRPSFPGASFGRHNSRVTTWERVKGEPVVVIGGFESGIDAAWHLSRLGRRVVVLDPTAPWRKQKEDDPSLTLSPYTWDRLRRLRRQGSAARETKVQFLAEAVTGIEETSGGYTVKTARRAIRTPTRPILATGFSGSLERIRELWDWDRESGLPRLDGATDESTRTPGLFLCGPGVRHRTADGLAVFCFVYKFRMRFAVVAATIARRLGRDPSRMLAEYAAANMIWDDGHSCRSPA